MKKTMMGIALALLALAGCRREDVREFAVGVPALPPSNTNAIHNALAGCVGVDVGSLKFDFETRRVTVRYDSMQTAKTNILVAFAKIGLEAFTELRRGEHVVTNSVRPDQMAYVTNATSNARR